MKPILKILFLFYGMLSFAQDKNSCFEFTIGTGYNMDQNIYNTNVLVLNYQTVVSVQSKRRLCYYFGMYKNVALDEKNFMRSGLIFSYTPKAFILSSGSDKSFLAGIGSISIPVDYVYNFKQRVYNRSYSYITLGTGLIYNKYLDVVDVREKLKSQCFSRIAWGRRIYYKRKYLCGIELSYKYTIPLKLNVTQNVVIINALSLSLLF